MWFLLSDVGQRYSTSLSFRSDQNGSSIIIYPIQVDQLTQIASRRIFEYVQGSDAIFITINELIVALSDLVSRTVDYEALDEELRVQVLSSSICRSRKRWRRDLEMNKNLSFV
jgi:hypothetical protein